jgi:membrane protein
MNIKQTIAQLREQAQRLIQSPADELDRGGRLLAYQVRLGLFCGRKLVKDRLQVTASALSYKTLLSIIPVLVLLWMLINALVPSGEIRDGVREAVFSAVHLDEISDSATVAGQAATEGRPADASDVAATPSADRRNTLREVITEMIDKQVSGIQGGGASVTIISVVLFVWAGMSIFKTVEGAFNYIWEVRRGRTLLNRFRDFISSLVVVALFLGLAVFWQKRQGGFNLGGVAMVVPLMGTWLLFFVIYKTMPTVQVRNRAAITAALVAGTVWELGAKTGLLLYLKYAAGPQKLYGNLALIPILMLWIWLSWIIVLFGAELSYVIQHMKTLTQDWFDRQQTARFLRGDVAALAVATEVGRRFASAEEPPTRQELSDALGSSESDAGEMVRVLQEAGLIRPAERRDGQKGYQPSRPLEQISAASVAEAGLSVELRPSGKASRGRSLHWARGLMTEKTGEASEVLAGETLATLVLRSREK